MIYFLKQAFLSDRNPTGGPVRSGQADYPSCQSEAEAMSCCLTVTRADAMQVCQNIRPLVLTNQAKDILVL